jgi:hypothetical protein
MTDIPGSALEIKKANEKQNNTSGDWASSLNIGEMWREHPVATGVTTAAVAAAAAYAAYRFGPAALRALPEMGTAMKYGTAATAAAAGLYGAGKLVFGDGANTLSGNSWTEHGANLLRSASDLSLVGGATAAGIGVLTHNPGLTMKGFGAIAAGAGTHVGLDYLAPRTEQLRTASAAIGHTQDWSADVPFNGAGKAKGGYNAVPLDRLNADALDRKQKMPATIVCDELGCYDVQAITGGKIGLDRFAEGKRSFGVYKLVNDSDEPFMQGAGKVRDWKSIGAESHETSSLRTLLAEKNPKLDINRMLMEDQIKHRRYLQDIG